MKSLKEKLRAGHVLFGSTVTEYLRPSVVKLFRDAGVDFIFIENEHAMFDPERLSDFILCARDNGLPVVAKLPELERASTARLLEAGTVGIQLPRTEQLHDLEQLRSYVKYPPIGTRASATGYGNTFYKKPADKSEWYRQANADTLLVAHIETQIGVQNVAELVTLPELDICFVGLSDLSLDYGMPGDYGGSEFRAIVQQIVTVSREHGVIPGLPAFDYESTKYWIDRGVQFFECASELDLLRIGASRLFQDLDRARVGCAT